jgi:hypothetical protein
MAENNSMEAEIAKGLGEAFKGAPIDTTGLEFNIAPPVKQEATPLVEPPKEENTPQRPVEKTPEPPVVKSFEEQFAETTGGKFKSWKEVEELLSAPKEDLDEEIKHFQELKKSGTKFDREFFDVYTKDYDSMTDAADVLKEAMRLEEDNKGISDKALEYKLKAKYNFDKWSEDGEEPTETELVMRELMEQDAERALAKLKERKANLLTIKKLEQPDLTAQKEVARQNLLKLEKEIDEELLPKFAKLPIVIDEKVDGKTKEKTVESFEFETPEADRKWAADTMKLMYSDVSVFWDQFKDEKGEFDKSQVLEMLLWKKNKNNITKAIHQNSFAKGRETEFKEINNVNFKPEGTNQTAKGNSLVDAFKKSLNIP